MFKFCQSETNSQQQANRHIPFVSHASKGQQQMVKAPTTLTFNPKQDKSSNKYLIPNNTHKTISNGNYILQYNAHNTNENNISGEVVIKDKNTNLLVYQGEYFNSEKNGYGIQYDEHGQIMYEGQFREDKRDGWGRTKQYEGQFRQNDHDGWGRYITPKIFYQGYFTEGRYNGIGIQIQAEDQFKNFDELKHKKEKIDEFFISQLRKDDSNIFQKFGICQIYIGQWAKGQKNGSGKLWKRNGEWYTGQFSYGTIHGTGAHFNGKPTPHVSKGVFAKGQFKKSF